MTDSGVGFVCARAGWSGARQAQGAGIQSQDGCGPAVAPITTQTAGSQRIAEERDFANRSAAGKPGEERSGEDA
jgi:hypothetical protein